MKRRPGFFFDLFGTLILTHENNRAWDAWRPLLSFIESKKALNDRQSAAELFDGFWDGADDQPDGNETIFEHKISVFLDQIDIHPTQSRIRELADELCDAWQRELRIDPVAVSTLAALRGHFPTGLVTNFDHPPHIHKIVKDMKLSDYFSTIVISAEEMIKKPDPGILIIACNRARCTPAHSYYIGDSIVDYEAAMSAQMIPILIRRDGQGEPGGNYSRNDKYVETDKFLAGLANRGELLCIESLEQVLEIAFV